MRQEKLYRISLVLALAGLTLMYAASLYVQPRQIDPGEARKSWQGRIVEVEGVAENVSKSGGNLFLDLQGENGSIKVVDFRPKAAVSSGDRISVKGKIDVWHGRLEIIADQIRKSR
ncbi:MAG: OB-fold nucleic acid binding domain-containing protein [Candidatus Nanohaloarchaea archaeon]